MKYHLRTLVLLTVIAPPLLALAYFLAPRVVRAIEQARLASAAPPQPPPPLDLDADFEQAIERSAAVFLARIRQEPKTPE